MTHGRLSFALCCFDDYARTATIGGGGGGVRIIAFGTQLYYLCRNEKLARTKCQDRTLYGRGAAGVKTHDDCCVFSYLPRACQIGYRECSRLGGEDQARGGEEGVCLRWFERQKGGVTHFMHAPCSSADCRCSAGDILAL